MQLVLPYAKIKAESIWQRTGTQGKYSMNTLYFFLAVSSSGENRQFLGENVSHHKSQQLLHYFCLYWFFWLLYQFLWLQPNLCISHKALYSHVLSGTMVLYRRSEVDKSLLPLYKQLTLWTLCTHTPHIPCLHPCTPTPTNPLPPSTHLPSYFG